jgi:oligosaccharyltransferase complex subunit alpha (ribophorin I)
LHFINRAPLIEINDLVREIEVSHWGNVAVEETFELRNAGAELNQGFSRINYMHGQTGNSFNEFTQILPKDATDVYYRDVIGNISSSHVSMTEDGEHVKFEITPRFVLFGGWRITYYTGYNLDASNYISVENGKYVLSMDIGVVFEEDVVVDDLEVRVILPEGAT